MPQRSQNIDKAKQLLAQAGHPNGFSTELYTEDYQEVPQYAQIIKQAAAGVGININLHVQSQADYYGDAVFGKSNWLDGAMSLVDYGHRGVPNVLLGAPLLSSGSWNSAHFKNSTYDGLANSYVGSLDLTSQRKYAGQIEQLLLDETPLILAFWFDSISVTKKPVAGVVTTGMGQIYLKQAGLT